MTAYIPGFVPSAADRYYNEIIAKLQARIDDLSAKRDTPAPQPMTDEHEAGLTEAQQQAEVALDKVMNCRFSNFDAGAVIHWAERGMYQVKAVAPSFPTPASDIAALREENTELNRIKIPHGFRWIDQAITVTGGDYQYDGQLLCSFPKEQGGAVRYIVRDANNRLFIHNAQQCGLEA